LCGLWTNQRLGGRRHQSTGDGRFFYISSHVTSPLLVVVGGLFLVGRVPGPVPGLGMAFLDFDGGSVRSCFSNSVHSDRSFDCTLFHAGGENSPLPVPRHLVHCRDGTSEVSPLGGGIYLPR
jgi:hypothetical protein